MIGKVIVIVMCAAACSAQMPADCSEFDIVRREPICEEPVYRDSVCRAEPFDDRFYGREIVQQRVDRSRTYPVILSNDAPDTGLPPVIQAPPVVTPVRERPVIRLPIGPIPRERIVSHKCHCTKTIIRPQLIQRVITVPKIQRYLRRGYRPVIENIAYTACPRCESYEQPTVDDVPIRRALPLEFSQVSSIC
ncbi:UNVERIFIED_CONTAM: hypothetical protein PYX00_006428 [Menopon gallinae]|uniref:Uncharacterized protein n=1 Tax=Menopon gallinae TaxID=328185 RepID=A0AAW2HV69_9NEOP